MFCFYRDKLVKKKYENNKDYIRSVKKILKGNRRKKKLLYII